jgi:hypothetical protein
VHAKAKTGGGGLLQQEGCDAKLNAVVAAVTNRYRLAVRAGMGRAAPSLEPAGPAALRSSATHLDGEAKRLHVPPCRTARGASPIAARARATSGLGGSAYRPCRWKRAAERRCRTKAALAAIGSRPRSQSLRSARAPVRPWRKENQRPGAVFARGRAPHALAPLRRGCCSRLAEDNRSLAPIAAHAGIRSREASGDGVATGRRQGSTLALLPFVARSSSRMRGRCSRPQ